MNDQPGTGRGSAQPTYGPHGQPDSRAEAAPGLELVPYQPPRRGRERLRAYSWLLLFLFALTAVLASQVRKQPTLVHVADTPPPVEEPTGALLDAYQQARLASVRVEARCGSWHGPVMGVGSGFFVTSDGMLLTAYHVVEGTSTPACSVVRWVGVTSDERVLRLDLVGFDAYMDLAAMQADVSRAVPFIPLSDRTPSAGTPVVAIGNSRDQFLAARAGRVTRLGVQASRADFADDTIELTNSLAPGDSGGPVVNGRGEAVGVVSFISFNPSAMSSQSFVPGFLQGLSLSRDFASYAVPLTKSSQIVQAVMAGHQRDLPVIGFSWARSDYRPGAGPHDLGPRPGPVVSEVAPGGPADLAGIRSQTQEVTTNPDGSSGFKLVADVIVAMDGVATPTFYELLAQVKSKEIGQVVTLTVQRGAATYRIDLELGAKTSVFAGG